MSNDVPDHLKRRLSVFRKNHNVQVEGFNLVESVLKDDNQGVLVVTNHVATWGIDCIVIGAELIYRTDRIPNTIADHRDFEYLFLKRVLNNVGAYPIDKLLADITPESEISKKLAEGQNIIGHVDKGYHLVGNQGEPDQRYLRYAHHGKAKIVSVYVTGLDQVYGVNEENRLMNALGGYLERKHGKPHLDMPYGLPNDMFAFFSTVLGIPYFHLKAPHDITIRFSPNIEIVKDQNYAAVDTKVRKNIRDLM